MIDFAVRNQIQKEVWGLIQGRPALDKMSCFENLSNDLKFKMVWDEINFEIFNIAFKWAKYLLKYKSTFVFKDKDLYICYLENIDGSLRGRGCY